MRISRLARAIGAFGLLASCGAGVDVGRAAPARVAVPGGELMIAGPPGYCIDPGSTQASTLGTFLLLGQCAGPFGLGTRTQPTGPELLTLIVSHEGRWPTGSEGILADLAAYFETETGRASLGRGGEAETVEILSSTLTSDTLYLHLRDTSAPAFGLAEESWRMVFMLGGQFLMAGVIAPEANSVASGAAEALLKEFATQMRKANPGAGLV